MVVTCHAVDAFWKSTNRWEVKCESEMWFDWESYSEGQCTGTNFNSFLMANLSHLNYLTNFFLCFFIFSSQMSLICRMAWSISITRSDTLTLIPIPLASLYFSFYKDEATWSKYFKCKNLWGCDSVLRNMCPVLCERSKRAELFQMQNSARLWLSS